MSHFPGHASAVREPAGLKPCATNEWDVFSKSLAAIRYEHQGAMQAETIGCKNKECQHSIDEKNRLT